MKYFRRYLLDRHMQSHHQISIKTVNPEESAQNDQSNSSTSWISYSSFHNQASDENQQATPKSAQTTQFPLENPIQWATFDGLSKQAITKGNFNSFQGQIPQSKPQTSTVNHF